MLAELRADLLTKPDSLSARFENKLASIESKLDGLQTTINDNEQRISDLESGLNQLQLLESQVTNMADDNARLRARVTDLEGRTRRCNVCLIGIPEVVEGTRPTSFFSKLLVDILGEDVLSAPPEIGVGLTGPLDQNWWKEVNPHPLSSASTGSRPKTL